MKRRISELFEASLGAGGYTPPAFAAKVRKQTPATPPEQKNLVIAALPLHPRSEAAQSDARRIPPRFTLHFPLFSLAMIFAIIALAATASAKPSQNDVFKSIQDNVGNTDGSATSPLPWACIGAGVILLLIIFGRPQRAPGAPKPLNNANRLLREVMRSLPVKPGEFKHLRTLADETTVSPGDQPLRSPLVLLLCPSAVAKAVKSGDTRADRKMLVQLLKKFENE